MNVHRSLFGGAPKPRGQPSNTADLPRDVGCSTFSSQIWKEHKQKSPQHPDSGAAHPRFKTRRQWKTIPQVVKEFQDLITYEEFSIEKISLPFNLVLISFYFPRSCLAKFLKRMGSMQDKYGPELFFDAWRSGAKFVPTSVNAIDNVLWNDCGDSIRRLKWNLFFSITDSSLDNSGSVAENFPGSYSTIFDSRLGRKPTVTPLNALLATQAARHQPFNEVWNFNRQLYKASLSCWIILEIFVGQQTCPRVIWRSLGNWNNILIGWSNSHRLNGRQEYGTNCLSRPYYALEIVQSLFEMQQWLAQAMSWIFICNLLQYNMISEPLEWRFCDLCGGDLCDQQEGEFLSTVCRERCVFSLVVVGVINIEP